ncbi:MAG TPA: PAS domain S-box protein, partial [Candidatus Nanopelagicales bacterium]|nr:PAS domain S-box protein [Candidatus Nanopelagicales bacterium]
MSVAEPQEQYRAFFESCPEMLGILDREGRVVRANRAWREALGGEGDRLPERVPEAQRAQLAEGLGGCGGGETGAWTGPVFTAEGQIERFAFTWGADGQGSLHAMGRRLRRVEPMSNEDRRARALIRYADIGIIGVSWEGEIVSWNPAA